MFQSIESIFLLVHGFSYQKVDLSFGEINKKERKTEKKFRITLCIESQFLKENAIFNDLI